MLLIKTFVSAPLSSVHGGGFIMDMVYDTIIYFCFWENQRIATTEIIPNAIATNGFNTDESKTANFGSTDIYCQL